MPWKRFLCQTGVWKNTKDFFPKAGVVRRKIEVETRHEVGAVQFVNGIRKSANKTEKKIFFMKAFSTNNPGITEHPFAKDKPRHRPYISHKKINSNQQN